MPQDAFTLRLNALELNKMLKGGRINKINQPAREEISFLIYTGSRTLKLNLCANAENCGVYFSDEEQENPLVAPNFCMLLRKHLQSAEISEVDSPNFERILRFRFKCVSDFSSCERILYAEIMGKYSNLILTENGVILGALKSTSLDFGSKRMIFSGASYVPPAPQDKVNPSDFAALSRTLSEADGDISKYLFTHVAGLAPVTAEMIVDSFQGGDFAKHVSEFLFSDEISACVKEAGGAPVDFLARRVEGAIPFPTLSEAQSYFYGKRRAAKQFERQKAKLESVVKTALKKQEKRLAQVLERKTACADAEENRVKGELLTANLYRLERGMSGCELENYYDGTLLKIALDNTLTPAQNAQSYYKKYRKQKRTLEMVAPQEAEIRAESDYLESVYSLVSSADDLNDLKSIEEELLAAGLVKPPQEKARKKKPEVPFRSFEQGGFEILAGRNNLQNEKLLRSCDSEDIWLHAQKYHSCHVVIRTNGRAVPDTVLEFAARICARYSSAKGERIPVDYCRLKYVKKPKGSRAGFVVYTDYKTILAEALQQFDA